MNVVPAQTAGVPHITLVSPPQKDFDGQIHPTILAAAGLLGITDVYAIGGASAIGALTYGVSDIDLAPVNVITGPGNVYVAAAKREVRGHVGIDSEAGPTEILIIADETARSRFVAADVISQAEHDELASSVVVTWDQKWADQFLHDLSQLSEQTFHKDRVQRSLTGTQSALVLVDGPQQAVDFSNAYAPEHLEIHTVNAHALSLLTTNAGAIFLGDYTPVSLGDYAAGSNHVLPTHGQAHFSSGLGAYTFLKPQQVIEYDHDALRELQGVVRTLSDDEFLPAHGDAVDIRFSTEED
jgi:histidinol dehydrogenase